MRDKIAKAVKQTIKKFKEHHDLSDEEMDRLSVVVATIILSTPEIRHTVYVALAEVADRISKVLKKHYENMVEKIKNKKDVLN